MDLLSLDRKHWRGDPLVAADGAASGRGEPSSFPEYKSTAHTAGRLNDQSAFTADAPCDVLQMAGDLLFGDPQGLRNLPRADRPALQECRHFLPKGPLGHVWRLSASSVAGEPGRQHDQCDGAVEEGSPDPVRDRDQDCPDQQKGVAGDVDLVERSSRHRMSGRK